MNRYRRQNPDNLRTKPCRVRRRRTRVRIARMEQVNPKSRAAHILARRASKEGLVKVSEIDGKFAGTSVERADPKSSRRWAQKEPGLPERMVETGQMSPAEFPEFVRSFLRLFK